MPVVLDTHAAVWYLLDSDKLSEPTYSLIDGAAANGTPTYASAISLVEVVYLVERGRIAADAFDRFVDDGWPGSRDFRDPGSRSLIIWIVCSQSRPRSNNTSTS